MPYIQQNISKNQLNMPEFNKGGREMLLENYLDAGILLMDLMRASKGKRISFNKGDVIVVGKKCEVHEANTRGDCITLAAIEAAIEFCKED